MPEEQPTKTDHYPINTEIVLTVQGTTETTKCNFRNVDWKEFQRLLKEKLSTHALEQKLTSAQMFYRKLDEVNTAMLNTIEELVPTSCPSPYMKRWWTQELLQLRSNTRKAGRKAYKKQHNRSDQAHEQYWKARNMYMNAIAKSKREHWDNLLENVDHKSMWTVNHYATGEHTDGSHTRIPTLKAKGQNGETSMASTNNRKADMLFDNFFPTCKCVMHLLSHHAPTGAWYFVDTISSNIIVIVCTSGMRL